MYSDVIMYINVAAERMMELSLSCLDNTTTSKHCAYYVDSYAYNTVSRVPTSSKTRVRARGDSLGLSVRFPSD